jgi:hypothetical protein
MQNPRYAENFNNLAVCKEKYCIVNHQRHHTFTVEHVQQNRTTWYRPLEEQAILILPHTDLRQSASLHQHRR